MSLPTTIDIELMRGDSHEIVMTATDDDGPFDLTGATIRWQLAKTATGTPIISKAVGTGITIDADPTTGKFVIAIAASDTEALKGAYYHECEVRKTGKVSTLFTGAMTFQADLITAAP